MFKKAVAWLVDVSAKYAVTAALGSVSITAIVNAVVRANVIPSWEVAWVIWTSTAFVSYVVLLKTAHRWLPASHSANQPENLDYDPKAKKHFSPKSVLELFELASARTSTRERDAAITPHIGLWLTVEGTISDVRDDEGDDGEGGRWASAVIDYRTPDERKGYPHRLFTRPRHVTVHFFGADANAIRALSVGDYIKANGRLRSIASLGGIVLAPAELIDYRSAPPQSAPPQSHTSQNPE